jgi:hypothetical protein
VHKVSKAIGGMGMSNCELSKRYRYSFSTHTLELDFVDDYVKKKTLTRHGSGSYIQYFLLLLP